MASDIAAGLGYLHSKNICHGDLKCDNVLLAKRDSGEVADAEGGAPANLLLAKVGGGGLT